MSFDKIFGSLNISASGLHTQRKKLDTISSNIANANTTRTEKGGPYRRRFIVMEEKKIDGFEVVLREKSNKLATSHAKHLQGKNFTVQREGEKIGVEASIHEDDSEFKIVYDPNHPDADAEGYVRLPNVNMVTEMVDMISASRNYEANLSAIDAAKKMARAALDI